VTEQTLPFWTRLWLAFACFFQLLGDGRFAARVAELRGERRELPRAPEPAPIPKAEPEPKPVRVAPPSAPEAALVLLGLLQREGRFVDFVQQEIVKFSDAEVGAVARVVHAGCRKALAQHAQLAPVRSEAEGSPIAVDAGYDAASIKLTGNVRGSAPYRGILRHRGWRAEKLELPKLVAGSPADVLAPAEVEL
jgi:hypothetical protein